MKVWILFGDLDYEGSDTLGVFGTQEEAERLMAWGQANATASYPDEPKHTSWRYDNLRIEEWTLGEMSKRITEADPKPI